MQLEKVLVTGAGGLLGAYMVEELKGRARVSGLDLQAPGAALPFTAGSVEDPVIVAKACQGQDAVIHIAARPNIWSGSGAEIMHTNAVGTWNVLEAAEQAGVRRVILTSSDSVVKKQSEAWRIHSPTKTVEAAMIAAPTSATSAGPSACSRCRAP